MSLPRTSKQPDGVSTADVKHAKLPPLPAEIILMIGSSIENIGDLKAFASSSKNAYRLIGPSIIRRNPAKALMHYAAVNDVHGIQQALNAGADIDTWYEPTGNERKNLLGWLDGSAFGKITPLHVAGINGSIGAAEYLLEQGASIDAATGDGVTALGLAANCGFVEMVRLLYKQGSRIDRVDWSGLTLLHHFTQRGNREMVRCLLELGADIEAQEIGDGNTSLGWAANLGNVDMCRLLREHGGDINYQNQLGWTTMHIAAKEGHLALTRYLLDNGASAHTTDNAGNTALLLSAKLARMDVFRLLHKNGDSDLNHADASGNTALHIAAEYADVELTLYLLKNGADLHIANGNGDIALGLAAKGAARLPFRRLDMSTEELQCIHQKAASAGKVFQLLQENGSDVDHKNHAGYTPRQLYDRSHRAFNMYSSLY